MCEKTDCEYKVTNGLTEVKDILMAMSNHLAAMHPALGGLKVEEEVAKVMLPFLHWRKESLKWRGLLGGLDLTVVLAS